jgi:hypothetical protein
MAVLRPQLQAQVSPRPAARGLERLLTLTDVHFLAGMSRGTGYCPSRSTTSSKDSYVTNFPARAGGLQPDALHVQELKLHGSSVAPPGGLAEGWGAISGAPLKGSPCPPCPSLVLSLWGNKYFSTLYLRDSRSSK